MDIQKNIKLLEKRMLETMVVIDKIDQSNIDGIIKRQILLNQFSMMKVEIEDLKETIEVNKSTDEILKKADAISLNEISLEGADA